MTDLWNFPRLSDLATWWAVAPYLGPGVAACTPMYVGLPNTTFSTLNLHEMDVYGHTYVLLGLTSKIYTGYQEEMSSNFPDVALTADQWTLQVDSSKIQMGP